MDGVIRQPRRSVVVITLEAYRDEALSRRNLLDVAVLDEGIRAAIFAVDKGHTKNPLLGSVKNQTDTRPKLSPIMHTVNI